MRARLIVVGGKTNKPAVDLRLPTVIGRGRDATLTIAHPMISRQHCELFERDGLLMIRDLASLNGTVIDGRRVQEAPLRPNDEFTVGPLTFRAEYQYDGDLSAIPSARFMDEAERGNGAFAGIAGRQAIEATPLDPNSLPVQPEAGMPDFLQALDAPAPGDAAPQFTPWAEPVAAESDPPENVGYGDDSEAIDRIELIEDFETVEAPPEENISADAGPIQNVPQPSQPQSPEAGDPALSDFFRRLQ